MLAVLEDLLAPGSTFSNRGAGPPVCSAIAPGGGGRARLREPICPPPGLGGACARNDRYRRDASWRPSWRFPIPRNWKLGYLAAQVPGFLSVHRVPTMPLQKRVEPGALRPGRRALPWTIALPDDMVSDGEGREGPLGFFTSLPRGQAGARAANFLRARSNPLSALWTAC